MSEAAIDCQKLTKRYDHSEVYALHELSLQVKSGEVYGYLGPNGAGKSTTIRLLMNFIQPTAGTAKIGGLDIVKDSVAVKKHTGYLAGDVALYQKTTGRELLDYLLKLQQAPDGAYRTQLEKRFEADLDKPIKSLSKGNRQKIGIIQAFMHRPEVLILDEPTSGLDPLMQEAFYDTVREARQHGAAILMSSHNLAEAQRICDRVGIIKHGKLVREQTISDSTDLGRPIFRIVLERGSDLAKLKQAKHLKFVSQDGPTALFQSTGDIAEALGTLSKYDIKDFSTQQLNLEDEFIEFYGEAEMITTIVWELRQRKSAIFWWTLGSILLSGLILLLYPPIRNQANEFNQVINQLPAGIRELKSGGASSINVADPVSFLNSQLFYITLPIIWIILAITRASGLLSRDEQNHTMELELARPISRGRLLLAKALSLVIEFIIVGGLTLAAIVIMAPLFDLHIGTAHLALATAYTIAFSLSFGLIAFALEAASSGGRRVASAFAVFLSFGGYLIASMSGLTDWLKVPVKFAPYHYFSPDKVMQGQAVRGLDIYLLGVLVFTAVLAYVGFRRRDID